MGSPALEEGAGLCAEVLPTGLVTRWPRSSKPAVADCKAAVSPHAAEVSVPALGRQLADPPMVEPFPHSFILGAKPTQPSPSLENSTAEGGRNKRICSWLRPNVPKTHSVCGLPKGLNYFCSIGERILKISGNRARVSWVGLVTSLGDQRTGRALGWRGSLNRQSLRPTLPALTRLGPYTLVPHLVLRDCAALGKPTSLSEPQCLYSQNNYDN